MRQINGKQYWHPVTTEMIFLGWIQNLISLYFIDTLTHKAHYRNQTKNKSGLRDSTQSRLTPCANPIGAWGRLSATCLSQNAGNGLRDAYLHLGHQMRVNAAGDVGGSVAKMFADGIQVFTCQNQQGGMGVP